MIVLNNSRVVGRRGSRPGLPNDAEPLFVWAVVVDRGYQRVGGDEGVVCDNKLL